MRTLPLRPEERNWKKKEEEIRPASISAFIPTALYILKIFFRRDRFRTRNERGFLLRENTRTRFVGRRDHSISFLPLFVLAQPTSLMNPTGRNPPHLRHCSFRKLSAEIRIFVSAPNVAFCLHYAPFVFYSDQRLQTTI